MARLLIVEDEFSAAKMLATILEMDGFSVTLAPNGKRAIEMIGDVQPDLIISDFMMPIMNGIEMARALRAMSEFADVPILITSGVPEQSLKPYESVYTGFLRKPFEIDVLLATIGSLLTNRRSAA